MYKAVLSRHVVQWLVLRIQMQHAEVMISEANNFVHAKSHAGKKKTGLASRVQITF